MSDAVREWRFYVGDMIVFGIVVTDVPTLLPTLRALRHASP